MTRTVSGLGRDFVTAASSKYSIDDATVTRRVESDSSRSHETREQDVAEDADHIARRFQSVDRADASLSRPHLDRGLPDRQARAHRPGQRDRLRKIRRIGLSEEGNG